MSEEDYAETKGYGANEAAQQIERCKAIEVLQQIERCDVTEAFQQIAGCKAIEAVQQDEYFDEIKRVGGRHRDYSESASSETSCSGYASQSPSKKLDSHYFYQGITIFVLNFSYRTTCIKIVGCISL